MEHELVKSAIEMVIGIAFLLLSWASMSIKKWLSAKIESEALESTMLRLHAVVETAVRNVAQTAVPVVKEAAGNGKISKDEAKKLRDTVKEAALDQLTKVEREYLDKLFEPGQLERIVVTMTEATVQKIKSAGAKQDV
jgi:polyhydroxyalkanoate synthesis regulator phasin